MSNVFNLVYTDPQLQGLFYADNKQSYYGKLVEFSQTKHIHKSIVNGYYSQTFLPIAFELCPKLFRCLKILCL